jgi:hypothetical protein
MRRRDPTIVKGRNSIGSVMASILMFLVLVWLGALLWITDPLWRWLVAGIGTIACLASPGGLACIYWLASSRYRQQWRDYRRGGPLPGSTV